MPMTEAEVKALLDTCVRHELVDHAFGDAEVEWFDKQEAKVASGYYGGDRADVLGGDGEYEGKFCYEGREARQFRKCGTLGVRERNDQTGPDQYQEGACLPGLTLHGVRSELTGE